MTQRIFFHRTLFALGGLMLLGGCDFIGMDNPFKEQRAPQTVEGTRHAPILNPSMASPMAAPAIAAVPAGNAPVMKPPPASADPFDYYDASGNPTVPKAAVAPQPSSYAPPQAVAPSYVSPPVAPVTPPASRKLPPENPYYAPPPYVAPAMPNVAPPDNSDSWVTKMFHSLGSDPGPARAPQTPLVPTHSAQAPLKPIILADASDSSPSWMAHTWVGHALTRETPKDAAAKEPYPALGSVPQTPEEFEAVKMGRDAKMTELKDDRLQAAIDKEKLDGEPSQQQATPQESNVVPRAASSDAEILLGHVHTDTPATSAPAAPQTADDAAAPAGSEPEQHLLSLTPSNQQ